MHLQKHFAEDLSESDLVKAFNALRRKLSNSQYLQWAINLDKPVNQVVYCYTTNCDLVAVRCNPFPPKSWNNLIWINFVIHPRVKKVPKHSSLYSECSLGYISNGCWDKLLWQIWTLIFSLDVSFFFLTNILK